MAKYCVKVLEVWSTEVEVEAESKQEAQAIAEEKFVENGLDEDGETQYDYTLDRHKWPVTEIDSNLEMCS
jgi:hypothetical protein